MKYTVNTETKIIELESNIIMEPTQLIEYIQEINEIFPDYKISIISPSFKITNSEIDWTRTPYPSLPFNPYNPNTTEPFGPFYCTNNTN